MSEASAILARIDIMDITTAVELFSESATVTFGTAEPLVGRNAIDTGTVAFFTSIAALHPQHSQRMERRRGYHRRHGGDIHGRYDGKQMTVPAVTSWRVGDDGLITDVFADQTPVYAA